MKIPPLVRLAMELITWKRLLFNRFTLLAVVICIATVTGAAYVDENDDGTVAGSVVTESGDPVANANVTLRQIPLQGVPKVASTTTNADGEFEFRDRTKLLEYIIQVKIDGTVVASEHHHLYFRGQNQQLVVEIDE
ncbi:carboxypeptidase-like regulatory domain-containing protein [Haladaptatus pallidirubidus]|uniref:Carboxypeptidase regulatory-like domain-containing protein n=1 Tax=Haladaptatus pallidirubidus TaxID=1008152 RepID=A0AAV3UJC7_9EURY|nr:carboxypeptidase-like regulatory domain-containing protein [Haladaptatus pallidirubidus]